MAGDISGSSLGLRVGFKPNHCPILLACKEPSICSFSPESGFAGVSHCLGGASRLSSLLGDDSKGQEEESPQHSLAFALNV